MLPTVWKSPTQPWHVKTPGELQEVISQAISSMKPPCCCPSVRVQVCCTREAGLGCRQQGSEGAQAGSDAAGIVLVK